MGEGQNTYEYAGGSRAMSIVLKNKQDTEKRTFCSSLSAHPKNWESATGFRSKYPLPSFIAYASLSIVSTQPRVNDKIMLTYR